MDFSGHKWGLKFGRPGRVSNKQFKYVPRYYDKDKEEFEYNVAKARRERDLAENPDTPLEGDHKDRMRKAMQFRTDAFNTTKNSMNKFSAIRTIIIAGVLFTIFYLLFSSEIILRIFDAFYNE